MRLADAKRLAEYHMSRHLNMGLWELRFNHNMNHLGFCFHPKRKQRGRIELSRHYVFLNTPSFVLDTILHEVAHALVGPGHGHDVVWQSKAIELGANPTPCKQAKMPRGKYGAVCPCCRDVFRRHRRPSARADVFCKTCGPHRGILNFTLIGETHRESAATS